MPTVSEFNADLRSNLADNSQGQTPQFQQIDLDSFRNQAFRSLYKRSIAKQVCNFLTTYTDMPLAVYNQLYYPLPSGWLRVTDVSYWSNEINTMFISRCGMYDDRERAGLICIYDAPAFVNYRIQMLGLAKWTGVDDPTMPDEVYDAVLAGAEFFAAKSLMNRRAQLRRQSTTVDNALGSEVLFYKNALQNYKEALKWARKAPRPVGR